MEIISLTPDKPTILAIRHKKEEVRMEVELFNRRTYKGNYGIFDEINKYWATLPENEQNAIFKCYVQAASILDEVTDVYELKKYLTPILTKLCDFHDPEVIANWIMLNGIAKIPMSIPVEYVEDFTTPNTRGKTYTRSEYVKLVGLVVILRAILPIVGNYMKTVKIEVGSNFKEFSALGLIKKTKLFDSAPMNDLRRYIAEYTNPRIYKNEDENRASRVLSFMSAEDFPNWLLATVVFRKLIIADLRGTTDTNTLVAGLFLHVDSSTQGGSASFSGMVKFKNQTDDDPNKPSSDTDKSFLEDHKNHTDLSPGHVVRILHEVDKPNEQLLFMLFPYDDIETISRICFSKKPKTGTVVTDGQIKIAQNVLNCVIPGKGLEYADMPQLSKLAQLTQAALWHRGFLDIAILMTCQPAEGSTGSYASTDYIRSNIPQELIAAINERYPYQRVKGTAKNPVIELINEVDADLKLNEWVLNAPQSLLEAAQYDFSSGRYVIPKDIKISLAKLAIAISEGQFHRTLRSV